MYRNLSWDVQRRAYQTSGQLARKALMLGFGPEAGDAADFRRHGLCWCDWQQPRRLRRAAQPHR
ncbi:MAG TPA: hypothetical protein VLY63_08960 [Anaerolineae bacterium]|nr:hypothetical protein [Anaerolineae bacterium]